MIVCMMMENVTRIKSQVTISEGESANACENILVDDISYKSLICPKPLPVIFNKRDLLCTIL